MAKNKLIHCKACNAEIAASAKICPHCGAKNKKPIYKRAWFWVIIVVLVLSFAGGGGEEETPVPAEIKTDSISTQAEQPADIPATTVTVTEPAKLVFEPLTAVDNESCKILVKDIDPDNIWGYTINLELENKTADKTFMFTLDYCSVNGVMVETLFAEEVAPGKKALESVSFNANNLKNIGVSEFTDIELSFRVYDSNDWTNYVVKNEVVNLYPYGAEKAVPFVREDLSSDILVFDNDKVKAVVIGTREDSIWGYSVDMYLENRTQSAAMFTAEEASINGYMCDPFFASEVAAGKCEYVTLSWGDSQLEELGITDYSQITNLEYCFRVYNSENWSGNDYAKEIVVLENP